MIKLKNVVLESPEQMEFIIEGMRNPMNSWEKSDTCFSDESCVNCYDGQRNLCNKDSFFRKDEKLGSNDHSLMQRLSNAGTEHRKYMRMMPVYVRITAPLYWWKEFDTYSVGVAPNPTDIIMNSCSTMHKIAEKEFTVEDFSCEHLGVFITTNRTIRQASVLKHLYVIFVRYMIRNRMKTILKGIMGIYVHLRREVNMAKIADSSIDGELTIKVKATLTVDEDTFDTCVNIMTIYAREHGIKGMTLDFRKTAPSRLGRFLMSDEAVEDILGAKTKYNK